MRAPDSGSTERIGVALAMEQFERIGHAFREQSQRDFGIDAHVELIESNRPTGRLLAVQLKAGESHLSERVEEGFVFRSDRLHVSYWLSHSLPVLICLCDLETREIYWQVVNGETAVSTGKGYKFNVPQSQRVDHRSATTFRDILTPVVAHSRYTIFTEEDQSHGAAKRYSCKAVLNGTLSKVEVAAVVRQLTSDGAKRRYHRNHLVEARWGDSDAQVVSTFIYPSAEDYARQNFVCRSCWISERLPEEFRPIQFTGENVGDNVIVEWNPNHLALAELTMASLVTKEDYLSRVLPLIQELESLLDAVEKGLRSLSSGELSESAFLSGSERTRSRIGEVAGDIEHLPMSPFECREMDLKLREIAAFLDNIRILYSATGMETWRQSSRLNQSLSQATDARRSLDHLKYETEKIR